MRTRWWLLVLLAYYATVILVRAPGELIWDEDNYVALAQRLTAGRYTTPAELDLWFGPGYPIVLMPLAVLDLPWNAWRLLNAGLLVAAVAYFHATLRLYLAPRGATLGAVLFGLYPLWLTEAATIMTEPLATLLVCGFAYHFCRLHQPGGRPWAHRLLAAGFAGWLALTKVFFGYVLATGLVAALAFAAFRNTRRAAANAAAACALGLLLCAPYLAYTRALTGKTFYWGTSGGMSLYWMASPYPGEYGAWLPDHFRGDARIAGHHQPFFDSIAGLGPLERDAAFKREALRHIRAHPAKYLQNWVANVGRLLFGYPFGYMHQRRATYAVMLPNMFLYTAAVLCLYPAWRRRGRVPAELGMLLVLWAIAFGGSSLLSAYERQGRVILPWLALWIAYTLTRILRIEFRADDT